MLQLKINNPAIVSYLLSCLVSLVFIHKILGEQSLKEEAQHRVLVTELGSELWTHIYMRCNAAVLGSSAACYDSSIEAIGNIDYPFGAPQISHPLDSTPWGLHLTGPYPDGVSYLLSWFSGNATLGAATALLSNYSVKNGGLTIAPSAVVKLWTDPNYSTGSLSSPRAVSVRTGETLTYLRNITAPGYQNFSYISPLISHVLLHDLQPGTTYFYMVGDGVDSWSTAKSFSTLPISLSTPVRIGLMADVGQTYNSSQTMARMLLSAPHVAILTGDYSYADHYSASDPNPGTSGPGTNQQRWDTFAVMWEPLMSTVPLLGCAGNHELEVSGISATLNYTISNFSYPQNYPFQSYSARYPVPGTTSNFGDITSNQYYVTTIAGSITLMTLNNYIPFHTESPQYIWAVQTLESINRTQVPWLLVQFHAPIYHTYFTHYKEQECFASIWEPLFYKFRVDVIFSGHVHAYERSHPVYQYQVDTCGPMYVLIGDGGNIEGPYRNFVDEMDPSTGDLYCVELSYNGMGPVKILNDGNTAWGPSYQRQVHPPNCPTTTWQLPKGVSGGPTSVHMNNSSLEGFCQSSQPLWSAHRDPSFGHALLEVMSKDEAKLSWYRNIDPPGIAADTLTLLRRNSCMEQQAAVEAVVEAAVEAAVGASKGSGENTSQKPTTFDNVQRIVTLDQPVKLILSISSLYCLAISGDFNEFIYLLSDLVASSWSNQNPTATILKGDFTVTAITTPCGSFNISTSSQVSQTVSTSSASSSTLHRVRRRSSSRSLTSLSATSAAGSTRNLRGSLTVGSPSGNASVVVDALISLPPLTFTSEQVTNFCMQYAISSADVFDAQLSSAAVFVATYGVLDLSARCGGTDSSEASIAVLPDHTVALVVVICVVSALTMAVFTMAVLRIYKTSRSHCHDHSSYEKGVVAMGVRYEGSGAGEARAGTGDETERLMYSALNGNSGLDNSSQDQR